MPFFRPFYKGGEGLEREVMYFKCVSQSGQPQEARRQQEGEGVVDIDRGHRKKGKASVTEVASVRTNETAPPKGGGRRQHHPQGTAKTEDRTKDGGRGTEEGKHHTKEGLDNTTQEEEGDSTTHHNEKSRKKDSQKSTKNQGKTKEALFFFFFDISFNFFVFQFFPFVFFSHFCEIGLFGQTGERGPKHLNIRHFLIFEFLVHEKFENQIFKWSKRKHENKK